jgi:DUF1009 family protein
LIKGTYSKIKPDKHDLINIKIGINSLNKLNAYNHVQALVVRNNSVLVKETSSGTKRMLLSINKTKKKQGILIKFPKKKQDLRADLPTVGLDTIKDCKKADIKGIVLKANQNIFLDKKKCIDFVNKNKMFIKTI